MYRQFANTHFRNGFADLGHDRAAIAQSGQLDALVALECIGTRFSFSRYDEIYAEGDGSDCWYKVVSGTVRVCKLLADGRRHIAEFCLSPDFSQRVDFRVAKREGTGKRMRKVAVVG